MQIPQIRIQSTLAQIDIQSTQATQTIHQPKGELLIEQPHAELNIHRTPSRLTIDQTRAWEQMGKLHVSRAIEEAARQGYQDYLQSIAKKRQEGDELMKIENGFSAISGQAKRNSEKPYNGFQLAWIPAHGSVNINYDPGTLDIHWKVNKPIINSRINKPVIEYDPGKVYINLKQQASLNIDFVNLTI